MKNKLVIFGIIMIGIFMGVINVHAEEPTPTATPSWPVNLSHNEHEYTIEGIELRVYKFDADNVETITKEEDGGTVTITTSEDAKKYVNDEPTRVITLSPTEYTITPEYKDDKINGCNTVFIKLNLNITQEKLEELFSNELNQVTDKITYMVEMVVNYKLTKTNERFKYFRNSNTMKELVNTLIPEMGRKKYISGLNMTNSQVFNTLFLEKNSEGNTEFILEKELSKEAKSLYFSLNYLMLLETENEDTEKIENAQLIMFHDYDNIEFLIENTNEIEDGAKNEIEDSMTTETPDDGQYVNVDNTAKEVPKYVYLMSIISILLGIVAIILVVNRKNLSKSTSIE